MPNLAILLKDEITRIARKTLKSELEGLRKSSSQYRSEIAALKRRITSLETQMRRAGKTAKVTRKNGLQDDAGEAPAIRFSPSGFARHRERLGLTRKEAGALLGASAFSVSNWEAVNPPTQPRKKFFPAIAAFRKLGRREALARLEEMGL